MKRTSIRDVFITVIVGASVGYLIQLLLVRAALHALTPPFTLPLTLVAAAIAVFILAWPIRQALNGTRKRPVNAIFASRVAMFAKASTVSGGLLTGFTAGLTVFAFTRPVMPAVSSTVVLLSSVVASVLLLIAGALAERFCTLPPDDGDEAESVEPAHG